jgi:hypothetical protein
MVLVVGLGLVGFCGWWFGWSRWLVLVWLVLVWLVSMVGFGLVGFGWIWLVGSS